MSQGTTSVVQKIDMILAEPNSAGDTRLRGLNPAGAKN